MANFLVIFLIEAGCKPKSPFIALEIALGETPSCLASEL